MRSVSRNLFVAILLRSALLCVSSQLVIAQAPPTPPFAQCPHVGAANSCGVLIVINANNTVSVYADSSIPPYENSEDTLTGVQNNSSKTITSLPLKSTTDLFGFDGDGICDSSITPKPAGCPFGTTGYEGPGVTFSNISSDSTAGTVNFNPGIPPGGSAYFGLEEALTAAQVTVPLNTTCPASTANVGAFYSSQLVGTGGNGSYIWSVASGSLSPLTLSSSGLISGTPTAAGTLNFTLKITDGAAASATQSCSITVANQQSGSGPTVVGTPVLTKVDPGATCSTSAPPASTSFLSTDPVILVWLVLSGVSNGDTVLISWTDPSGTPQPSLNISIGPLTGLSAGVNYIFCGGIIPGSNISGGQWTVNVSWNNQTPPLASIPFTVTNVSGGSGGTGPTCSANTNCSVLGTANIFGSGHPADQTPAPAGGGGGTAAPVFTFTAGAGQAITFTSITGAVSPCSTCNPPLDGGSGGADISGYKGITGYKGAKQFPLVGVFLDNSEPADPSPATLDFNSIGSTFTTLSPALRQVFYIGDGKTNGAPRQYVVPATATRMYLGFADGFAFGGIPGYYNDNTGSLTVVFALGAASTGGGGGGTTINLQTVLQQLNLSPGSYPNPTVLASAGLTIVANAPGTGGAAGTGTLLVQAVGPNEVHPAGTTTEAFFQGPGIAYNVLNCTTLSWTGTSALTGFTITRPGMINNASIPAWTMYAYDATGNLLDTKGEGNLSTGSFLEPTGYASFTLSSATPINRVVFCSHNGLSTYNALPLSGGNGAAGGGGSGGTVGCPSASNLIQNCGAEAGAAGGWVGIPSIPGWTTDGNVAVVAYTDPNGDLTPTSPGPSNPGNNYFGGGNVASSQISQTIDLSTSASAIDAGTQPYTLDGWLGGWDGQDDNATLTATFQNASGATLGSAQITSPDSSARNGTTELVEVTKTGTVPAGTRKVLITVLFTRVSGVANDSLADNLFFGLTGSGGGTGGGNPPPTLTGSNCSPSVSPHDINDATGNGISPPQNGLIFVGSNCQWSAYSPVSWVTVTPSYPTTQAGSGAWTYSLQPNNAPGAISRSATLSVASIQVTVEQTVSSSGACSFSLDSTSNSSSNTPPSAYTGGAGSFHVTVTGNSLCSFTVTTPADPAKKWVQLASSNFSGTGEFTVNYSVGQNNTTSARNLSLAITGFAQSNSSFTSTYTINQSAGPSNTVPAPVIGAITNSASFIPSSLSAGAIAQGSFFSIFGTDLGPANPGVTATGDTFATTLANVSVTVTKGSQSVAAIPQFVAQFQINAIMPSNAPTGTVQVTVTFNGLTSAPSTITVVANNFGAFAVAGGHGPGIVQNYVPATQQTPLNTAGVSAAPGDTVILWGTGLGPLPNGAPDNQPYPPPGQPVQSLPVSVQVFVGTLAVKPDYSGRAPQFKGVDQINFVVPANAPQGCYVPIQVVVAGTNYSNVITMAIQANRGACSDTNPLSTMSRAGGKDGVINLLRINLTDATTPSNNGSADLGLAVFQQDSAGGAFGFDLFSSLPPLNACTYYNNLNFLNGLLGGQVPSRPGSTNLDAGSSITVTGPNGSRALPYASSSSPASPYLGLLGAGGGFSTYIQSQPFLSPGSYTISGPGGKDVGPFSFSMNVTANISTNLSQISMIDRTQGLTINWTGGDPASQAALIMGASNDVFTNVSGGFVCLAPLGPSSFTVPAGVMANLPSTAGSSVGEVQSSILFLAVPLGNKFVQFNTSAAASLDNGLAFSLVGELRNDVTFK